MRLRQRRRTNYKNLHHHGHTQVGITDSELEHIVMAQLSWKKGIKEFDQAGRDALLKELQQKHDMEVFEPVSPKELTTCVPSGSLSSG